MPALTLTLLRLGFLALLWLFVLIAVSVMRSDLFGTKVSQRQRSGRAKPTATRAPKPPRAPRGRSKRPTTLVVTGGPIAGTTLTLGEAPVTIGRSPSSTLSLDDDYASTNHARLYQHEGQWVVEDLQSTNGTYLDRTKVLRPTLVPMGVPVRIGKTVLELRR